MWPHGNFNAKSAKNLDCKNPDSGFSWKWEDPVSQGLSRPELSRRVHQRFLPLTLAAWPGNLSVTPHLCLYSEDTHYSREGIVGCRQEAVPGSCQEEGPRAPSSGVATIVFSSPTSKIFHCLITGKDIKVFSIFGKHLLI